MSDLMIKQYAQFLSNKIQACHSKFDSQDAKTFLEIQSTLLCMAGDIKELEKANTELKDKITKLEAVVEAAAAVDEYLQSNELNCLGSGSILHRDLKFQLSELGESDEKAR